MNTAAPLQQPPVIAPVAVANRPQWSVMIPVYNCATFLPRTLQSVLQQDAGNGQMQIEVVDDASTDANVEALVQQIGNGRIRYFRQPQNVGSRKNFETCLNRSRGYLVHLLHGDDMVKEGYYKKIAALFQQYPHTGAAFCRYNYINEHDAQLMLAPAEAAEDGLLKNWLLRIAVRQRIQYCAITVRRDAYETLGGFYGPPYGEDWETWVRLAAHYPVAYTPEVLADYRRHESSISGRSFLTGQNLRDLHWVINTVQQYLPQAERKRAKEEALRYYAHYGVTTAYRLWQVAQQKEGALAQMQAARQLHGDLKLYLRMAKLYAQIAFNRR